jgi:hypothetical protein
VIPSAPVVIVTPTRQSITRFIAAFSRKAIRLDGLSFFSP